MGTLRRVAGLIFVGSAVAAGVAAAGALFLGLVVDGAVAVGRRRRAATRELTRRFDS